MKINIPAGVTLSDTVKLYVFNEQYNSDKKTDYASALLDVASAPVNKLVSIAKPTAITGVANGTKKTAEALGLPKTVGITTTLGSPTSAAVEWNVDGCNYDQANEAEQTFDVSGTVILPDTVINSDSVSSAVTVNVSVSAKASPEINSVAVKTKPDKTSYTEGDTLDLTGLVITIGYSGGDPKDVPFSDFATSGVSTNPVHGAQLTTANTSVTVSAGGCSGSFGITVKEKSSGGYTPPSYEDSAPTYSVALPKQTPGGTVTSSPRYAEQGDRVTLTATPDEGYKLDSLTVKDSKNNPVELTDKGEGKYTFTMPGRSVTVEAKFSKIEETPAPWRNTFADVSEGAWYYDAVEYVCQNGLMAGTSATTFAPDVTTSRAMIATILWRQAGSPVVNYAMRFDDVDPNAYYGEAVRWAASEGIVSGYGNGKFGSNDPITREQLATMLYNYEKKQGGGFSGAWAFRLDFDDVASVSEWAYEPMSWMVMNGVISGTSSTTLSPKGQATRAQAATMLMRYLEAAGA